MRHGKVKTCSKCGQPRELVIHRTICHDCNLKRKRDVSAKALLLPENTALNRKRTAAYRQTPRGRAGLLIWFAAKRAKASQREFSLDVQNIADRIAKGRCEVTGLAFDMSPGPDKHHANPWAPSLDRRDSAGGYTTENVQVVCAAYNYAKSEWSADVLLRLARAIVDTHR